MKKRIFLIMFAVTALLYSCSDDWFTIMPKGQASIETFYTEKGADVLLIGAYGLIDGVTAGGSHSEGWASCVSNWVWGSVRGGDAYKGSNFGDQANINEIAGFFVNPANTYVNSHWVYNYDGVSRCNDVMTALQNATNIPAAKAARLEAETKFLRAHFYTELTLVHGTVPWIDETTVDRTAVPNDHVLWGEIETDMKFAVDNLPLTQVDKGRPTKWAAKTYLARIYLHQKKYAEAMPILRDVYANGGFTLVPHYNMNYLIATVNNSESIFEVQYSVNSGFAAQLANYGDALNQPSAKSISNFHQPSHNLVAAHRTTDAGLPLEADPLSYDQTDILPYDPSGATVPYTQPVDTRLDWSIARPGVPDYDWGTPMLSWIRDPINGGPYYFKKSSFLKSERLVMSSTTGRPGANANNYRKFKLSHVILWLSECETEAGNLGEATRLVNEIRNRAKNSTVVSFANGDPAANYRVEPYPADFATQEEARTAIRHEIRIEFSGEGDRFFDLVRWGIAGPVMNNFLTNDSKVMPHLKDQFFVPGQHELGPVPQTQIDISIDASGTKVLSQNPGY
jgi:starch-binding outer membrane protein, SusD/RagB family